MAHSGRLLVVALLGVCALTSAPRAAEPVSDRPRLAVVDFEAAPGGWTLPPPQVGGVAAELLLDRLVGVAPYQILDGRWLQPRDRRADRAGAFDALRRTAEESGVDYLLLGSITRFSAETHQRNAGAAGFKLPLLGGYHRQTNELVISIAVRVVNVRTGEVVSTALGDGTGARRNIALGALGLLRVPGFAAVSNGSASSRDAQLDEAIRQAVSAAADGLIRAAPRLTASGTISSRSSR
jgi:curli production assembly/transport component CsgG